MTDYTKTTDFGVKDGLSTGNAAKLVKGSEFDTEFDAIETAVATKADKASPTFTGTVTGANVTVNGTFKLADTSDDHYYTWAVNELTADRTVTWPLLTGNDTIVFEAHTATLTNKTIDLTSNTLQGSKTEFNTALESDTFLMSSDLLDEDTMTSNSATAPASQQSIKAYVDGKLATPADEGIQFYVGTTPTIDAGGLAYDEASGIAKLKINSDDQYNFAILQMGSDQIPLSYIDLGQANKISLNNIYAVDTGTATTIAQNSAIGLNTTDTDTAISNASSVEIKLDRGNETPNEVIIKFWNLIPATDGASLYFRLDSTAAGGDSGASDYRSGTTDSAQITIAGSVGSDTNENGVSGEIRIFTPHATSYTQVRAVGMYCNSANNIVTIDVAAHRSSTTAMTYAYLLFSSGNIESGKVGVYYVRTA